MHKGRPDRGQVGSGKHWFAGSVVAAGLGAAMMAGAGAATAETSGAAGADSSGNSVSASRDSSSTRTPREHRSSRADRTTRVRKTVTVDVGDKVIRDVDDEEPARVPAEDDSALPALAAATRKDLRAARVDPDEEARGTAVVSESRAATAEPEELPAAVAAMATAAAAPTTLRVTVGSMIVDWLYSIGVKDTKYGPDFLAIPVPGFVERWWLGVRARIYRDVVPDPGGPTEPQGPAQKRLLWETNFSSQAEAERYWGFQTGRWGWPAGENQYYTDGDNAYIDAAGNLVIEARREETPDRFGAPHNYTSARVVTFGKQSIGVGTRVVARIQMPVNQGALPAFWTVGLEPGHEYDWPRQGEIDIVEVPGFGTPVARRTWTGNIHGPADRDNTIDAKLPGFSKDLGVDLSQGFHEYGIDWYSDRIVWHVDGVEVGRVTKAQYEALGGDWRPFSGEWDHYLILNVAVGNPWTGDPATNAPFVAQMKVDWVKAYEL